MDNQEVSTASTLDIVNGGVEITVNFIEGLHQQVKVRQLPLRQMAAYGAAQGDEAKLIELFTNQTPDWVETLTTESQEEIVYLGDKLNIDFFLRWAERRMNANKKLQPLLPALASAKSALPS